MSAAPVPPGNVVKLSERFEVAERTMAFRFVKPRGFSFRAGQFVELTLLSPPETDAEGNSRAFSIASAPEENFLMIATRLRGSAMKRVLASMPLESDVKIEGPFGDLVLHNKAARPAVLLAGGIGITPFRSIVGHAAEHKLPHRIVLFYSNRRPEDAPFLEELLTLEKRNPNYRCVATMTEMGQSKREWKGERGYITKEMLSKHVADLVSPIYYVAGPPGMVAGLRAMLNQAGVDDDDIRAEEFSGY